MPITITRFVKFKELPCYSCYDPIREAPPQDELTWDSFQTATAEHENSLYEIPQMHSGRTPAESKQEVSQLNSFGTVTKLGWDGDTPHESYIDQLLETQSHLKHQLNELSGKDTGEELPLPKTLGEHQMKYLNKWRSTRQAVDDQSPQSSQHMSLAGQVSNPEGQDPSPLKVMSDILESSSNSSLAPGEEPLPSRFSQVARV